MKKGLKKFTVPYSGTYFDGGKIFGQRVVYAASAEDASRKVDGAFQKTNDEPIVHAGIAEKWHPGEKSDCEIFPYWGIDG